MRCAFTVRGHHNLLATHKNTLEFTKDKDLSKNGDCIVGINADFSKAELKKIIKTYRNLKLTITTSNIEDSFNFIANKDFNDSKELVFRRSEFNSNRTIGVRSDKASIDLNRSLIKKLQDPNTKALITIEPITKLFIFDFDDTLEDFNIAFEKANQHLAKFFTKHYKVNETDALKALKDADHIWGLKCKGSSPKLSDHHLWFNTAANTLKIKIEKKIMDKLVEEYWDVASKYAKAMPGATQLLTLIRKNYLVALMTDSDGSYDYKMKRILKVGLYDYFDYILVSDEVGQNKPSKKFYKKIFDHFNVTAKECVMVGDKPSVDLEPAKKLGLTTIYVKHGVWSSYLKDTNFDYIDYQVNNLKELIKIVKEEI